MASVSRFRIVVMGASAGGIQALSTVLAALPASFSIPIAIVLHRSDTKPHRLTELLNGRTPLQVVAGAEGNLAAGGSVYLAQPGTHLVIREDGRFGLSAAAKVHHVRPAADVLFTSAADVFREGVVAVVLTGGDGDGATGVTAVRSRGGATIAQSEGTSQAPSMPRSAIATGAIDFVVPLDAIAPKLIELSKWTVS